MYIIYIIFVNLYIICTLFLIFSRIQIMSWLCAFYYIIFLKVYIIFKFLDINVGILGYINCPTSKSHPC